MIVTIDFSAAAYQRGGIGRYALELVRAAQNLPPEARRSEARRYEYRLFYNQSQNTPASLPPELAALPTVTVALHDKPWRLRAALSVLTRFRQDSLFPSGQLFHATDHVLPYLPGPKVFTLHDLSYHFYPKTHNLPNRWYLRLFMPRFLHSATRIIANSENTRQDALRVYGIPPEKIQAVPLGVRADFCTKGEQEALATRQFYGIPERFLLAVGTIEPRKNLGVILRAIQPEEQIPLVIAGKRGWLAEGFFREVENLGLKERVKILGFVSENELPALYRAAELLVYPSLYEGFGLPILEAMACGTPVLASNTSSIPEAAGNSGMLIPPEDVRAWREAIVRVWKDPELRAEICARGIQHVRSFGWEQTLQSTFEVYDQALRT